MGFEELLERWQGGSLSHGEAALALGVSERILRRWRGRHEEDGADGLVDRRLGRPSPQRAPVAELDRMLGLYDETHQEVTVEHFHQKLVQHHGYKLGYTTTRLSLQKTGAVPPAPRRGAHRRKRPRRPMQGMMLHQDASKHGWLAGQAALDLVITLDDATSTIHSAFLVPEEGTQSSFRGLVETIERHGLFMELYTDRGSHYFFTPEAGGKVSRTQPTQVGRALAQPMAEPERVAEVLALFIEERAGLLWLSTHDGIWRLAEPTAEPERVAEGWALFVEERAGLLWLGTFEGLWRLAEPTAEPERVAEGGARFVKERAGLLWLGTKEGIWSMLDAEATVDLKSADSWWRNLIEAMVPGVLVEGVVKPAVRYEGPDAGLLHDLPERHFSYILETDFREYRRELEAEAFVPEYQEKALTAGFPQTLYIAVRDRWDNVYEQTPMRVWVMPGAYALPFVLALLVILVMTIVFLLAPYSRFFHGLLMNPYLRSYGSFGLIPLVITTVAPARNHLLRRYRRALADAPEFRDWPERYLLPSEEYLPERFSADLAAHRRVLLLGESGIGKTAFFRFFAASLVTGSAKPEPPRGTLPVFIPLGRYRAEKPADMIRAQLSNYGGLTDESLTSWMVENGGFVLLFDGMNEVEKPTRDAVNSFVESHWQAHWICVSSQVAYREFSHWLDARRLEPLTPEKVDEAIRHRLDAGRAGSVIAQMTDDLYRFYGVPQNLELALDLLEGRSDQALPKSREELYAAVFEPQFEAWREAGRGDLPELLTERAYVMLRDRRPADFDAEGRRVPLPDEVRDLLIEKRLFVQRGEDVFFRHDLLRAYLAALHFSARWARLLETDCDKCDGNWLSMLKFALRRIAETGDGTSDQLREVVDAVYDADPDVAADLVDWLEEEHPRLCAPWRAAFDRRYGEQHRKRRVA